MQKDHDLIQGEGRAGVNEAIGIWISYMVGVLTGGALVWLKIGSLPAKPSQIEAWIDDECRKLRLLKRFSGGVGRSTGTLITSEHGQFEITIRTAQLTENTSTSTSGKE